MLLELVEMGFSREDSYAIAQSAAMDTWNTGVPYRETLRKHAADTAVSSSTRPRLDAVCRPERYLERLGGVFERVAALS